MKYTEVEKEKIRATFQIEHFGRVFPSTLRRLVVAGVVVEDIERKVKEWRELINK